MQISSIESPIARSASSLEIEISIATNPSNPVSYNPCQWECQRSILFAEFTDFPIKSSINDFQFIASPKNVTIFDFAPALPGPHFHEFD